MKIVLDTNIYISALISDAASPYALLELWKRNAFTLLTSGYQVSEIRRVTRRDHIRPLIAPYQAGALVNRLRAKAVMIEPREVPDVSADPDDNFILAIAKEGGADYLASTNMKHVVKLKRLSRTKIVHARELLRELS